ncbi:MAG: PQQ-binding-like beta-propeller repeat protein [Chloroflexi bacterium]|nr:PQQ-binding-like beta-propeller repeat protein [Chloroflexota bacterium]MBU1747729.1 PQQ-binding-like beta-propeller repeat protein [Chloroflexota bacterium]MBU1880247.1 PQQ-binding-like beta-propeller repeat protein [Chloroflexota bacterium]
MRTETNVIRRDLVVGASETGSTDQLLPTGSTLQKRYEVQDVLGVGGMSTVYLVRDHRFAHATKLCAMKEMAEHSNDPGTRRLHLSTFEREANILATLNHPAIPKIYDFFAEKQRHYLVMEYIDGKNLEDLLSETRAFIPQEQIIDWAIQICDVLIYLHSQQSYPIIFRDLKPANIMITRDQRLVLIDFGIARIFESGTRGTMIGTEGYSPPEQYRGVATPATDIYALGATLHHLITRRDPRQETPFTFHERPPRTINPAISTQLEAIVMKALAYDVEDRYTSAAEVKMTLLGLFQTGGLDADAAKRFGLGTHGFPTADEPAPAAVARPTQLVWKFACEEEVRSSPCVAMDLVLVGCYDHNVYALDAQDGSFRWKFPTDAGISSSPCTEQNMVFVGSEDGGLYALDIPTGRSLWHFRTAGAIRSSPRVIRNLVIVGSDDYHLYAVDVRWGRQSWKCRLWDRVRSSPFLDDDAAYVGCDDGLIYAVNLDGGSIRWRTRTQNRVVSSPTGADGLLFVGSTDYNIYALDVQNGWPVWRYRTKHYVTSSPAYHKGRVYVGSVDGRLYCLEAKSGRLLWSYEAEGQITSSPRVMGELVFFGGVDGYIYALRIEDGSLHWRYQADGPVPSSPFVTTNTVYVGSMDHHVYALKM